MDLATIGAKALKKAGKLPDLDESEEINACSVKIKAVIDGREQDYLLMFKNETHNHRPRSSRSAARPPVWAAPSATPSRAGAMSIRRCG